MNIVCDFRRGSFIELDPLHLIMQKCLTGIRFFLIIHLSIYVPHIQMSKSPRQISFWLKVPIPLLPNLSNLWHQIYEDTSIKIPRVIISIFNVISNVSELPHPLLNQHDTQCLTTKCFSSPHSIPRHNTETLDAQHTTERQQSHRHEHWRQYQWFQHQGCREI